MDDLAAKEAELRATAADLRTRLDEVWSQIRAVREEGARRRLEERTQDPMMGVRRRLQDAERKSRRWVAAGARALIGRGCTVGEVAEVFDLSPIRVKQILENERPKR